MNEFAHLREGGHVASSGGGVGDGLKGPRPGAGGGGVPGGVGPGGGQAEPTWPFPLGRRRQSCPTYSQGGPFKWRKKSWCPHSIWFYVMSSRFSPPSPSPQ